MATPSIKSLIVNALVGKTSLERVEREFLLNKYIKIHSPFNMRGIPRAYVPMSEFLQGLKRNGVTDAELDEWEAEWVELVRSCEKRAKMRTMNELSIETLLRAKLAGSGIRYTLRKQQYRVALTLTMSHNTQATFYIQHSKFREQLDMVLPAVEQLNRLMDELGQPIRVKNLDRSADWRDLDE